MTQKLELKEEFYSAGAVEVAETNYLNMVEPVHPTNWANSCPFRDFHDLIADPFTRKQIDALQ